MWANFSYTFSEVNHKHNTKNLTALAFKNIYAWSTAKTSMQKDCSLWRDTADTNSFMNCFLFYITNLGSAEGCFQSLQTLGAGLDQVDGTKQTLVGKWVGWMDVWKILCDHEFCNIHQNALY